MSNETPKKMIRINVSLSGATNSPDLDAATQKFLEAVDVCQIEIDNLNEKASEEILKIEQKFNQMRKPHFEKRCEIIKNIPNFWLTALMNHPDLSAIIDDSEEDCLHHLTKIEVEEFEDIKSGYQIEFHFEENPYFENTVLTKECHMELGNPITKSTEIKWKEGVTLGRRAENNAGKGGRKRRLESKSFFAWFSDVVDPTSDDIAEIFKDDLYQNPLQYYLVPDMESSNGMENEEASDSSGLEEIQDDDEDEQVNQQSSSGNAS